MLPQIAPQVRHPPQPSHILVNFISTPKV